MRQRIFNESSSHPYKITEFENFLTLEECDALIELARPRLFESKVYEAKADTLDKSIRISMQCWIHDNERNPIVEEINRKIERIVNIPSKFYESLQVVRYEKGGFYRPHYDACNDAPEKCQRMNEPFGSQRYMTFLIYLNDDYEGGETHFPSLPYTTRPQKGMAILFYDTDPRGKIIPESLHGGEPIHRGEKWICNRWIHYPMVQEHYGSGINQRILRSKWLWLGVIIVGIALICLGVRLNRKRV
jgi:prolyl 4-hydroxylase